MAFRSAAWASPKNIAGTIAEQFVKSPHLVESGPLNYPEVCTWYGALSFAEVTGDKELAKRLQSRFEPLLGPAERDRVPNERHVDYEVFGVVPLELYRQTHEDKYLKVRKELFRPSMGLAPKGRFVRGDPLLDR